MKTLGYTLLLSVITVHTATAQNTGIGTTAPTMALHVSKATDTALLLLENRTTLAANTSTGLYFKTGSYYTGAIKAIGTGTNVSRLSFFTYADGNQNELQERMSIADNGRVGIGATAPTADLHVKGTLRLEATGAAAGKVLTSDANGNATWQAPAATPTGGSSDGFSATLASDIVLVSGAATDVSGFTEKFDDGGAFNPATGRFTAPSDGLYQFTYSLSFNETGTDTKYLSIRIKRNGAIHLSYSAVSPGINSNWSSNMVNTFIIKLDAGEYISLSVERSASNGNTLRGGNFANSTSFQGYKVY